ncbi:hypothetical protein EIN_419700 [Entamoeba invadens IP1]|uniref:Rho-GAP domain-containing protein n=1 Tax=Entamoeba invadens IP1 TaxID=370355 RepID=A0A0A1U1Z7_ENTIV|nr:hypothetical protein EIN_419700 [Entamoeba invadens IP1]ELP88021.1 hypothetical protein EIN_419700 [Entamoeba invadens IP1]|eukprot:XP_004254792.1 hypothetical protein EIN_419700 [Entamoeba invadens IP1]
MVTVQKEEIFFSQFKLFEEHLSYLTPSLLLDFFNAFTSFFTLGSSFFQENVFITNLLETKKTHENTPDFVSYVGKTIKDILEEEHKTVNELPKTIDSIISVLYKKGFLIKGIFRESQVASIRQVEEICMRLSVTDFENVNVEVVALVFKKFLRNLPVRIFNREQTEMMMSVWKSLNNNSSSLEIALKNLLIVINKLPEEHQLVFKSSLKLCFKIAKNSFINAMDEKNISVCLANNFFTFLPVDNMEIYENAMTEEISICIKFFQFCITNFQLMFPDQIDENVIQNVINEQNELLTQPVKIPEKPETQNKESPKTTESMEFIKPVFKKTETPPDDAVLKNYEEFEKAQKGVSQCGGANRKHKVCNESGETFTLKSLSGKTKIDENQAIENGTENVKKVNLIFFNRNVTPRDNVTENLTTREIVQRDVLHRSPRNSINFNFEKKNEKEKECGIVVERDNTKAETINKQKIEKNDEDDESIEMPTKVQASIKIPQQDKMKKDIDEDISFKVFINTGGIPKLCEKSNPNFDV